MRYDGLAAGLPVLMAAIGNRRLVDQRVEKLSSEARHDQIDHLVDAEPGDNDGLHSSSSYRLQPEGVLRLAEGRAVVAPGDENKPRQSQMFRTDFAKAVEVMNWEELPA